MKTLNNMVNLFQVFSEQMVDEELALSRKHGVKLIVQPCSVLENETKKLPSTSLLLNDAMINFYTNYVWLDISWRPHPEKEPVNIIRNDSWLHENYFNNDYSFDFVYGEMLTGDINIQRLEDMLNPEYCKEESYFIAMSSSSFSGDYKPEEFLPFDIHWSLTACLRIVNGEILDNIWLVDADAMKVYDMEITIEKYLDLAYKAKCFHYWQYVYLKKGKSERYELMKRYLPVFLPHIKLEQLDLSDFGIELIN